MFTTVPFLLIFNCLFIYLFRKWLGPFGIFFLSSSVNFLVIISLIIILYMQTLSNSYWFVDFGRFFFCYDLLDSYLVFIFDSLSILLSLLVLTLTLFAQFFGVEYMYREAFIIRLVYLLNFFATSVVFLFLVYDFFLVLIVWELIGLFSLLLVNFYSSRLYTLKAAFKTFIFSRVSDFFIFIAFFFFILVFNTTEFSLLFLEIPFMLFFNIYILNFGFNLLNLLAFLIALSGAIKAAQFMFHVWLPDAMEAPTPASALIHSSTLVIMGIYLIIRFSLLYEFSFSANYFIAILGGLTIASGAVAASFQNDIKKLVAYSTVSQMGYLFCGCGFLAYSEVIFYLIIHAINKAFLFILVGYTVHYFSGNTDLRFMGSLYNYSIDTTFLFLIISLNLTGLPLTSGFFAKEFLVFQTLKGDSISTLVRFFWQVSFIFTPFYMLLLNLSVVFRPKFSAVKLYLNYNFYFWKNTQSGFTFTMHDFSLLYSKLTSFILFFVFTLVIFNGELFIFYFFDFLAFNVNQSSNIWLPTWTFDSSFSITTSSILISLLTWNILFSTTFAFSLLLKLFKQCF